jgi:Ca2+-dependent lipid-binding protein
MSFLELPKVDFTVSSFGGWDLSKIPIAFQFINSSIYWMLEQVIIHYIIYILYYNLFIIIYIIYLFI